MKLHRTSARSRALLALITAFLALPSAQAASASWTTVTSGDWTTGPWSATYPNGVSEIATFSQNWTGQTINVDAPITVGQILASDSASATGGLGISGGTLTLNNGSGVAPIISTGAGSFFNETAALRFRIASTLDGSNGFERQGTGYLDLSGSTNVFTGTVRITGTTGGSFTVVNSDANLGASSNVITVATTASATGLYNDASAGSFTLNSARTITTTGTGDFWVKNKTGANMTIAGEISGTANLRKNDSGTLTLTGANSYAGTTRLDGGRLVLSGGNNRLPTGTTVAFNSASTLDLTNTSQSVAALTPLAGGTSTITGAGGSLTVTNNANFAVNGADATTLDMSGLSNFTYNQATRTFSVQPATNGTTSNNTLQLAKAGTNAITALTMNIGGATGSSQGTAHEGRLGLGTGNQFNAGTLNVGGFNGSGLMSFQSGLTDPSLTLRGVSGGTSRLDTVVIGSTSSGTRSGAGVLNLTGGSLDARVGTMTINRHLAASANSATSSVTMPSGSLDATTIVLGDKTSTGAPTLTTSFNQGGGTVKVGTLTFGQDAAAGATTNFQSSYNLAAGTLNAATIQSGSGAFNSSSLRRIGWTGGTISNYDSATNLTIDGVSGAGGAIVIATSGAATKTFSVDSGRTTTLGANSSLTGSSDLAKSGPGTLILSSGATHTYNGKLTISEGAVAIDAVLSGASMSVAGGTLGGNGTVGAVALSSGALAPGNSIGTLTASSLTWDDSAVMRFELAGLTNSDLLLLGAGAFLKGTGSAFMFDFAGGGEIGGSYTLTMFGSTSFTEQDFVASNLASGLTGSFVLETDRLILNVAAIPEPSTWAAIAGAVALVIALRRRRTT